MEFSTSFRTQNSKTWLCSLLSYFLNIKSIDDNIEVLRISLCSQPNFSPYKLFHYLDHSNKDFLLLNDFIQFLNELRIPFEEKYLRIFIHNFDKDCDFSLNMKEFLGLILPKKNIDLANNVAKNLNKNNADDITGTNSKNIFGKLLCEELELVKNCIKTAKACKENIGFTIYEAFFAIAGNNKYINETFLYNFLKKNNIDISTNDMHQLMFRLDADNDGKISFEEFKEIFFPIKGEEIVYKIRDNIDIINENYNDICLRKEKENKEKKEDKIDEKKINNLVDFTFAENSNDINPKISYKMNGVYRSGLNKLMNYNYEEDLLQNKENKQININLNRDDKNDVIKSIYSRTKNLLGEKSHNLFKNRIPPKIIIQTKPTIPEPQIFSKVYTPNPKNYQFVYSNEPLIMKKNLNQNIITSPYRPKRVETQRKEGYQSPKTKHTKSPLNYDYSTYSDEDGEEYYKQKKLKEKKVAYTDKRVKNIKDNKLNNIFGGFDCKNEIKNNLEKMFLEDEEDNKKKLYMNEITKQIKKRKFNFISNDSEENDIKRNNYDDILRKKYKNENFI